VDVPGNQQHGFQRERNMLRTLLQRARSLKSHPWRNGR
jgi:hypothetical protein